MFKSTLRLTLLTLVISADVNASCQQAEQNIKASRFTTSDEPKAAYKRRKGAAYLRNLCERKISITQENNGDEKRVPNFAAQFSKGLEHSPDTGILTDSGQQNYKQLRKAIQTGSQKAYNKVKRAPFAIRKFTNPQGSAAFSFIGNDSSQFRMKLFPRIDSPEAAALLLELYLMELCRDVDFNDYGRGTNSDDNGSGGSLTGDAATFLQTLGTAYTGPKNPETGLVDPSVLFRGNSYANLIGPYISQFLLLPLKTIPKTIFPPAENMNSLQNNSAFIPGPFTQFDQRRPIAMQREFGISFNDFVAIQNGEIPVGYQSSDYGSDTRYIITGRDLASVVHCDTPYEVYYNALNVLFSNGFSFTHISPYADGTICNEDPFVTLGYFDVYSLIGGVAGEAAKAAWAHKWRAERVLRPEAFAGLVQNVMTTGQNPYNLSETFFYPYSGIKVLERVRAHNESNINGASTYLLSLVYPEGSPLHPSYPSGHATIAGACITIIKALVDDSAKISSLVTPVKPDPLDPTKLIALLPSEGRDDLTVASELDKLAFNVGNGRNFAGIHYRADSDQGIRLGEQVAIKYLQDHAANLTEQTFRGFELTTIDGVRIKITATGVQKI